MTETFLGEKQMITNEEYTKAVNKLVDEDGVFYLFEIVTKAWSSWSGNDYIILNGKGINAEIHSDKVVFNSCDDAILTTEEYLAIGTLQQWVKERNDGQQSA